MYIVTCNDYCTYEGSEHATSLLKSEIYTFNDVCQQILINQIVMNFIACELRVIHKFFYKLEFLTDGAYCGDDAG